MEAKLKQIVVEFTKPKGMTFPVVSWLIRLAQWKFSKKQKWGDVPSHVRIRFFDKKHEVWWVYEASQSRLALYGYEALETTTSVIQRYEFFVPIDVKKKMVIWMNKNAGVAYGKLQLLGLGLVFALKIFGINIKNPGGDKAKTQVCTEATLLVLEQNEDFHQALKEVDQDKIDLCDLNLLLSKMFDEQKPVEESD